jgi:hypothetical protein
MHEWRCALKGTGCTLLQQLSLSDVGVTDRRHNAGRYHDRSSASESTLPAVAAVRSSY